MSNFLNKNFSLPLCNVHLSICLSTCVHLQYGKKNREENLVPVKNFGVLTY